MNKNVIDAMNSINSINRLQDEAYLDVHNAIMESQNKYEIIKEHGTVEYAQNEFYQESVLAGVLIGLGVIGLIASTILIIKKVNETSGKGSGKGTATPDKPAADMNLFESKSIEDKRKEFDAKVDEILKKIGNTDDATRDKIFEIAKCNKKLNATAVNSVAEAMDKVADQLDNFANKDPNEDSYATDAELIINEIEKLNKTIESNLDSLLIDIPEGDSITSAINDSFTIAASISDKLKKYDDKLSKVEPKLKALSEKAKKESKGTGSGTEDSDANNQNADADLEALQKRANGVLQPMGKDNHKFFETIRGYFNTVMSEVNKADYSSLTQQSQPTQQSENQPVQTQSSGTSNEKVTNMQADTFENDTARKIIEQRNQPVVGSPEKNDKTEQETPQSVNNESNDPYHIDKKEESRNIDIFNNNKKFFDSRGYHTYPGAKEFINKIFNASPSEVDYWLRSQRENGDIDYLKMLCDIADVRGLTSDQITIAKGKIKSSTDNEQTETSETKETPAENAVQHEKDIQSIKELAKKCNLNVSEEKWLKYIHGLRDRNEYVINAVIDEYNNPGTPEPFRKFYAGLFELASLDINNYLKNSEENYENRLHDRITEVMGKNPSAFYFKLSDPNGISAKEVIAAIMKNSDNSYCDMLLNISEDQFIRKMNEKYNEIKVSHQSFGFSVELEEMVQNILDHHKNVYNDFTWQPDTVKQYVSIVYGKGTDKIQQLAIESITNRIDKNDINNAVILYQIYDEIITANNLNININTDKINNFIQQFGQKMDAEEGEDEKEEDESEKRVKVAEGLMSKYTVSEDTFLDDTKSFLDADSDPNKDLKKVVNDRIASYITEHTPENADEAIKNQIKIKATKYVSGVLGVAGIDPSIVTNNQTPNTENATLQDIAKKYNATDDDINRIYNLFKNGDPKARELMKDNGDVGMAAQEVKTLFERERRDAKTEQPTATPAQQAATPAPKPEKKGVFNTLKETAGNVVKAVKSKFTGESYEEYILPSGEMTMVLVEYEITEYEDGSTEKRRIRIINE